MCAVIDNSMAYTTFKQWLLKQEQQMTDDDLQKQVATAAQRGIQNPGESATKNVQDTVTKLSQQTKDPDQLAKLATAADEVSGQKKLAMKKKMNKK